MGAAVGREDKCPVRASQGSAWTDGKGRGERGHPCRGASPCKGLELFFLRKSGTSWLRLVAE